MVTERQVNHCFENYQENDSSDDDDDDRGGTWNRSSFAFQPPDVAGSPWVILEHFTYVF